MVERRLIAVSFMLLAVAGCHSNRVDEGSVDTTLPNDTAVIASNADMIADNMELQADNMDAMADNMSAITPAYPSDSGTYGQPQSGVPQQGPVEPPADVGPSYGGQPGSSNSQ